MASNTPRSPAIDSIRERRGHRLKTPFGDEDIPIVFAGVGEFDLFHRRLSSNRKTALVYDERMLLHKNMWYPEFIERPDRISVPLQRCTEYGLLPRCLLIGTESASDDLLRHCHTDNYIKEILNTTTMNDDQRKDFASTLDAVYFNEYTNLAARLSAGSIIQAVESVHRGDARNAFCLIRPPGHHALENEATGFCIFNNVALAAHYVIDSLGYNRVLIIDWDVHHGNAIQQAFYDNPKVLYISIHRYDDQQFWPKLRESNYDFIGTGRGKGYNINVALNDKEIGDADYLAIFHRLILPVAYEYDPDLVLISAGYDSAFGCPLGELQLSPSIYAHLTHKLMCLAEGKVVVALEGGYNVDSLAESIGHTISALLGDPMPSLEPNKPVNPSVLQSIANCISVLRCRWKSLRIYPIADALLPALDTTKLKTCSWSDVKVPSIEPVDHDHTPEYKAELDKQLSYLKRTHPVAENTKITGTCLVYDNRMENHKNEEDRNHPECPQRIRRIFETLDECGLLRRCKRLEPRYATRAELLLIHTADYIDRISATASMDQNSLNQLADDEDSIYFNRHTYDCARLASGSVLTVVDEICMGRSLNGLAIIRPPGHHALSDRSMGFCFFNHVAVAARHAQKVYDLERIAIVDWDVHHGNGTAKIFENDPNILYISVHRYDDGRFFPHTDESSAEFCGSDLGSGRTVHISWNGRHIKDGEYISVFNHIILPILYEFRPQLILISAGFDAVRGDRLGGLGVSAECFGHLTHLLMTVAHLNPSSNCINPQHNSSTSSTRQTRHKQHQENCAAFSGGLILVLEGGYNVAATAESVCHCVASLLGDCCPRLAVNLAPTEKNCKCIQKTLSVHKKYWTQLQGYDPVLCHYDQDFSAHSRPGNSSGTRRVNSRYGISETEFNSLLDDFSLNESRLQSLSINQDQSFASPVAQHGHHLRRHLNQPRNNSLDNSRMSCGRNNTMNRVSNSNLSEPQQQQSELDLQATATEPTSTFEQVLPIINVESPVASNTPQATTALSQLTDAFSHLRVNSSRAGPTNHSSQTSESTSQPSSHPSNLINFPAGSSSTPVEQLDNASGHLHASTTLQELMRLSDVNGEDIHSFFGLPNSQPLPQQLFAITPLNWCPHLTAVRSFPDWEPDVNSLCTRCDNRGENWVCLSCYVIYCGRYANSHMIEHFSTTRHPIVLSFADLSSWCYECESYVHNETLLEAKRAAHRAKFGSDMPES